MRIIVLIIASVFFTSCGVFQPKAFSNLALEEELLTVDRKPISFNEVISSNNNQKKFVQIYASYCPISQDSFDDVIAFQEANKNVEYIFLSVDHSYHDWKRGLESLKVKGNHYYIQEKGKGELGAFLNLKTIPRFMVVDEQGNILLFKTSKVSENIQQKLN